MNRFFLILCSTLAGSGAFIVVAWDVLRLTNSVILPTWLSILAGGFTALSIVSRDYSQGRHRTEQRQESDSKGRGV